MIIKVGESLASNSLQIDDEYCNNMKQYFTDQGTKLEGYLTEYITILERIRDTGIKGGNVNEALNSYITYANKLKGKISDISTVANTHISTFLSKIDEADQFLF